MPTSRVEDIIQSGVKHTEYGDWLEGDERLDDIVENGVKKTSLKRGTRPFMVKDTIKNGVKETNPVDVMKFFDNKMEDALQNGVKETKQKKNAYLVLDTSGRELILESHLVIRDGVKETNYDTDNYTDDVKEVIREGVRTSHPRQYVGEIIIDKVIDNRVIETHDDAHNHKDRIDGVIKNGVKETKEMLDWACTDRMLSNILENGVKETKISPTHTEYGDWLDGDERLEEIIKNGVKVTRTPGNGDITSYVDWLKDNKTSGYQGMVEDVIENGVKETVAAGYTDPKTSILHIKWGDQIDDVIDNGVKEVVSYDEHKREPVNTFGYIDDIIKEGVKINGTYAGGQRQSEKCKSVVEYGTKNPTD
jgi:hypothetical protein